MPSFMPHSAEAHQANIFGNTFESSAALQGGWDDMQMEVPSGVTGLTPIAESAAAWESMGWGGFGEGTGR
jgi:hypothetical protein